MAVETDGHQEQRAVADEIESKPNVEELQESSIQLQVEQDEASGIDGFLLPRSTVLAIVNAADENASFSREAKDLFMKASTLFISYVSAAAMDTKIMRGKRNFQAAAFLAGLEATGFTSIANEITKPQSELEEQAPINGA